MKKKKQNKKKRNNIRGTKEWAVKTVNYITGCPRDCKYCFSKSIQVWSGRRTPENWKEERVRLHDLNKKVRYTEGRIMFPSSHDITLENLINSIKFIRKYLEAGNNMLIVSKPELPVIESLCKEFDDYKSQILFRFTIGSSNQEILSFWEPNAPKYIERKACLKHAFENGFETSVSSEPFLDNDIIDLVKELQNYVTDAIWIGKANKLRYGISINGHKDVETRKRASKLIEEVYSDDNIWRIYNELKSNPIIKWKESIKKVVGIERPSEFGLDI